jgi:hypothetical protein
METKIVQMTPEWASQLLKQNTHNRSLSKQRVAECANLITSGQWKLTHQGVAIDSNNVLQDGQHRLHAIIKAGVPVQIMLSTGCDPSNFEVIDSGKKRLASDAIYISGGKNATKSAAGIRGFLQYQRFPNYVWTGSSFTISALEINRFYKDNSELVDFISSVCIASYAIFRQFNASAGVAFALVAAQSDRLDEALKFIDLAGTGAGLKRFDPILAYRNFLANDRVKRSHQLYLATNIKFFNRWIDGESVKYFRLPDLTPMPIIALPVSSFAGSDQ